jgi:hypothetical protein
MFIYSSQKLQIFAGLLINELAQIRIGKMIQLTFPKDMFTIIFNTQDS